MKKLLSLWLAALLLLGGLLCARPADVQAAGDAPDATAAPDAPAYAAYDGKRIGVLVGPLMEDVAREYFPNSEHLLFNTYPDCITALISGRIDAYLSDELGVKAVRAERPDIDYIRQRITENNYSFAFRRNDEKSAALCAELNAFVARCWADGTMQELEDIWFGADEDRQVVDMTDLVGKNGTVRVITTSTDAPFSYIRDGKNVGYDIDLVVRFCRDRGYALELGDVDFAGRIPAIESGKYDFTTDMNVTPERQEQVLFSDPVCQGGIVLAVRSADIAGQSAAESASAAEPTSDGKLPITSLDRLSQPGVVIAVGLDTPAEASLREDYPQAKLVPYTDRFSAYLDVDRGRVDAFVGARREMEFALDHGMSGVRLLEENYAENKIAVGISPVSAILDLKDRLNAFIAEAKADGTLDEMYDRWVTRGEETMPDIPGVENPSFTLRVGTTGTVMPYSYYVGTELAGYDIELARRFARWLGAGLEFKVYDFGGIFPAAKTGAIDCIMSNLFYTEEKSESIPFSDVLFEVEITAMVKDDGKAASHTAEASITTPEQLGGKRIAVQTGTICGALAEARFPDAQVQYFNSQTDALTALKAGKVDAWVTDEPMLRFMKIDNPELAILDGFLSESNLAAIFPKTESGQVLCSQYSAFLKKLWDDGTMRQIDSVWFGSDDTKRTVMDYAHLPATNGTLRMAADLSQPPFTYVKDNRIVGYDVDIAARFCQEYGYGLEIVPMSFDAMLASVQSGKCDFSDSCITITEERAESMLFSVPNYYGSIAVGVLQGQEVSTSPAADGVFTSLSQLNGKRIGVQTGTSFDNAVFELLPDAEVSYFNSKADLVNALLTHKIDAYTVDEPVIKAQMQTDDRLSYIAEYMESFDFAYVFPKTDAGQALCSQFSEYLRMIRADGTMARIEAKWFGEDDSIKTIADYKSFPAPNGTLHMATEAMYEPFTYILNNQITGYDIDIVVGFCEAYGYGLEITDMNFDAVLPSVQSGKCDFGGAGITITAERAESVLFSEPNFSGGTVMAVLKAETAPAAPKAAATDEPVQPESFWDGIVSSFRKTFLREDRWKLFVDGVLTTLLITVLSILFGTALGFAVFMLCRNGNLIANGVTRFSMWLVQGMPMVVLLMILYYIIFGSVAISGIAVAVIGFTLTFGAAVVGLLRMGVGAVDNGQYEAACALGYSSRRTFYKIILPQALPHVMPAYRGEIVGLIKATAIVGYIAVQDLTKMGDIVRSRTYEAFFPLIAVTVIYFLLEGLIAFLIGRIGVSFDPKRRKPAEILKGVKTDD